MIETVYLVSIGGRSCIQHSKERLVSGGGEMLHFHIDGERACQIENFGQQRDWYPRWQPGLGNIGGTNGGDGAVPWKIGIMMYHDAVVAGSMNVQFNAVRAFVDGCSEGRK